MELVDPSNYISFEFLSLKPFNVSTFLPVDRLRLYHTISECSTVHVIISNAMAIFAMQRILLWGGYEPKIIPVGRQLKKISV